jgi:hypothetical protein
VEIRATSRPDTELKTHHFAGGHGELGEHLVVAAQVEIESNV